MLCESCKKNNATVSLTEIKDSKTTVYQLCETCARSQGCPGKQNLLGDLLSGFVAKARSAEATVEKACEVCGMTYRGFRAKGRLGCPHCYELFEEELTPLLEKIHGSAHHIGKAPRQEQGEEQSESDVLQRHRELTRLRRELRDVVQEEDYERAAQIRDRIQVLEVELSKGTSSPGPGPEAE